MTDKAKEPAGELPPLDETYKQEQAYALTLESGAQYSIVSLKAEVKCRERQLLSLQSELAAANARVKELEKVDARQEALDSQTIYERDRAQNVVAEVAAILGCENEWSNLHDHHECIYWYTYAISNRAEAAESQLSAIKEYAQGVKMPEVIRFTDPCAEGKGWFRCYQKCEIDSIWSGLMEVVTK